MIKFGVVLVYGIMTLQAAGSIWEQPEEYENTLWQEMAIPILTGERGWEIPDQGPPRAPVVHSEKETMDLGVREGAKEPEKAPAFAGTPYVSKNIIDSSDATAFVRLESRGRETWRGLAERFAVGVAFNSEPYIFDAFFTDGYRFELVVDGELGSEHEAGEVASDYAAEIGRLPKSVRSGIKAGMILNNHESYYAYGKAGIIVMGHGFTQVLIKSGAWGEALFHEGVHVSLDGAFIKHPDWLAAQKADREFISEYARENPSTEDLAESCLLWYAIRHRAVNERLRTQVEQLIPARLSFFDSLDFEH